MIWEGSENVITKEELENRDELFRLMRENPDLPIVPFVNGDVVYDCNFGMWMGSWGDVRIDEYLMPKDCYDPIMFKSDEDIFDVLEKMLSEEEFDSLPNTEKECMPIYDSLPWTKAIIVHIDVPNME